MHALCYFHLVIQGWIKHVEKAIEKSESSQCVFEIAKRWVRTWAFDLETEVEYKDSRTCFFNWLGEQQEMTISTAGAESIRRFIITVLDKYECMWVYHFRLQVYGMDQNTTQISEGMNWSVVIAMEVTVLTMMLLEKGSPFLIQAIARQQRNKKGAAL